LESDKERETNRILTEDGVFDVAWNVGAVESEYFKRNKSGYVTSREISFFQAVHSFMGTDLDENF